MKERPGRTEREDSVDMQQTGQQPEIPKWTRDAPVVAAQS